MAALDFSQIVKLINYSRTTFIEPTPSQESQGSWALHKGIYRIHSSEFPFSLLSLQSRATREALIQAERNAFTPGETHVVYPPSLAQRTPAYKELFEGKAGGFWTLSEYLASFIREEMRGYVTRLQQLEARDFIDPRITTPSGIRRKLPNPLLSFIRGGEGVESKGSLGVLLAEPGQGKTYLARQTAARLAADLRPIPVFVDSTQWQSIAPGELSSIAGTIIHSFRHFDSPISWLYGHEDEFLRVALKADLFRIVFDGFDEYVLANRGNTTAAEVLDALAELAEATESRILITSRTSFWQANVHSTETSDVRREVFEFEPFDIHSAQEYFKKRLKNEKQRLQAASIFQDLRSRSSDLAGRGFVLSLIADVADTPDSFPRDRPIDGDALEWLFEALCAREQLRQQLPLSAQDQLRILEAFAWELALHVEPTADVLDLCVESIRADLSPDARSNCVEKLRTHPLLVWTRQPERWGFRQEQAEVYFVARRVCVTKADELPMRVSRLSLSSGRRQDLASAILGVIAGRDQNAQVAEVRRIVRSLTDAKASAMDRSGAEDQLLASTLALSALDKWLRSGTSHSDRAQLLATLFGGPKVERVKFDGAIARLDLRGFEFVECTFDSISFAACRFDAATTFRRCHFIGGAAPQKCEGLAEVMLRDCTFDDIGASWWEAILVSAGRKSYTASALRNDLGLALMKFVGKGGMGFKTVTSHTFVRGAFGASRYRDEIRDALLSTAIDPHAISGTSESGYHVRDEAKAALQFFVANNVFIGPLKGAFDLLVKRLSIIE